MARGTRKGGMCGKKHKRSRKNTTRRGGSFWNTLGHVASTYTPQYAADARALRHVVGGRKRATRRGGSFLNPVNNAVRHTIRDLSGGRKKRTRRGRKMQGEN